MMKRRKPDLEATHEIEEEDPPPGAARKKAFTTALQQVAAMYLHICVPLQVSDRENLLLTLSSAESRHHERSPAFCCTSVNTPHTQFITLHTSVLGYDKTVKLVSYALPLAAQALRRLQRRLCVHHAFHAYAYMCACMCV